MLVCQSGVGPQLDSDLFISFVVTVGAEPAYSALTCAPCGSAVHSRSRRLDDRMDGGLETHVRKLPWENRGQLERPPEPHGKGCASALV